MEQVQLILSLKAAAVLDRAIEHGINEEFHFNDEESGILSSIREEIKFQMPREGKAKRRKTK